MKKPSTLLPVTILSLLVLPLGLQAKPDLPSPEKGGKPAQVDAAADKGKAKADAAKDKAKAKTDDAEAKVEEAKTKAEKTKEDAAKRAELEGKKADQERKELGKGSETGQAKRAENSRKWWKFWGGDKEAE